MWIKLHPPFGEGIKWEEINLPDNTKVESLLGLLVNLHPEMQPYMRFPEEDTMYHFILVREDRILSITDQIHPEDRIKIMLPITGG